MRVDDVKRNQRPLVSVIIPTYNRAEVLGRCLGALEVQNFDFGAFEIIVVDDGSSDATSEVVQKAEARFEIRYLRQDNSGPAAARNRGVRHAESDLILILNDDAIAFDSLVAAHYYTHLKLPGRERVAVLGTREYSSEDRIRTLNFLYDQVPFSMRVYGLKEGFYPPPYFVTFNVSLRKQDYETIGGFDEDFASAIGEDSEFGTRWDRSGGSLLFLPSLRAHHAHDMTVDGLKSMIIRETFNKLILIHKHRSCWKPSEIFRRPESELLEYVENRGSLMQRFEAELRECENLSIWEMEGREFMGSWIGCITDFVISVREYYPKFHNYVAIRRYFDDPGARAMVRKWAGELPSPVLRNAV